MSYLPCNCWAMDSSSSLRHCVTTERSLFRIAWSIVVVSLHHDLDAFAEQLEQVVLQPADRLLDLIFVLDRPGEKIGDPHPPQLAHRAA